jgi:predicted dehydrogenase
MGQKQPTTRRHFLKTSSAVVAGSALAGTLAAPRAVHADGSDEIKIALIGCGGRGNGATRNNLDACENTKVVAVADAFASKAASTAENLRQKYGDRVDLPDERVFSGFDAYKRAIACDVDMVILATPPGFRPLHYRAAVEADKHVFMEKPCCVDAPGYRSLVETNQTVDRKNLKVVVGLQRRHDAGYRNGIDEIRNGKYGDLFFLRAYWNGGGVWVRGRSEGETEMQYQMKNWYYFVWLCGDHICEQHVHNLDVVNWVMGEHPVEANGMGGREVRKGLDHGQIFDHHFVEFTYSDGTKMYSQCRHIRGCWKTVSEAAHGTQGAGGIRGRGRRRNPYEQEHVDLVNAIRNGEPLNAGHYGATSSFTAVLGRMATYSGKVVRWDDAVAKGPMEFPLDKQPTSWKEDPPVMPDENGRYPVAVPGVYEPY